MRAAVALVIFTLLVFTTVRTSPLSAGNGTASSLSKTTPKQRHLSVKEIDVAVPFVTHLELVHIDLGDVVPAKLSTPDFDHFSGRYFSLPPPA
jgi:hypothetical protein